MKKISLFLFTTILAINIVYAQNDWVTYKIDNKLSVKMPQHASHVDTNNFMALDKDSLIYIVGVANVVKMEGIDSVKLANIATTPKYVKGMRLKIIERVPGFKFGDLKVATWKGYTCYYINGENASAGVTIYSFLIFIGVNLYSLSAGVPENKSTKGKDDFFNSLTLN